MQFRHLKCKTFAFFNNYFSRLSKFDAFDEVISVGPTKTLCLWISLRYSCYYCGWMKTSHWFFFTCFQLKRVDYIYTIKQESGRFYLLCECRVEVQFYTTNTVDSLTRNNYKKSIWRDMGLFSINTIVYSKIPHYMTNSFTIIEVGHQMWEEHQHAFPILFSISLFLRSSPFIGVKDCKNNPKIKTSCVTNKITLIWMKTDIKSKETNRLISWQDL